MCVGGGVGISLHSGSLPASPSLPCLRPSAPRVRVKSHWDTCQEGEAAPLGTARQAQVGTQWGFADGGGERAQL